MICPGRTTVLRHALVGTQLMTCPGQDAVLRHTRVGTCPGLDIVLHAWVGQMYKVYFFHPGGNKTPFYSDT